MITDGAFARMLQTAFGNERAEVILRALDEDASTAIRINPLKISNPDYVIPEEGCKAVPWCSLGRILRQRPSTLKRWQTH